MKGKRKGTALIQWLLDSGVVKECDVKCRRSPKVAMDTCPCTGLCKGKSTKEATDLLKTPRIYMTLIHYARSRTFVNGIRIAPEVIQIEIDFDLPGHDRLGESRSE